MSKTLGRDINEFYNHQLDGDHYLRDKTPTCLSWFESYWTETGLDLPDNEEFDLQEFGNVYYLYTSSKFGSFEELFNYWMGNRPQTITIEVSQMDYDDALAQLKALDFKVVD